MEKGPAYVIEKKEPLKKQCAYVIFDIRNREDLKLAASAVSEERNICGSSAIGEELPYAIACRQKGAEEPVLLLSGSLTEQSIAQVEYMKERGYSVLEFPACEIYEEDGLEKKVHALTEVILQEMHEKGICLLHTSNRPPDGYWRQMAAVNWW